jgi:amidase
LAFRAAIHSAMLQSDIQAIIYPTWSNAPRKVGDTKSPAGDNSQVLSPQSGFPAITVPMGYTHEVLPAGLTFLGDSFSEGTLIKLAYAYEQATKNRHPPSKYPPLK